MTKRELYLGLNSVGGPVMLKVEFRERPEGLELSICGTSTGPRGYYCGGQIDILEEVKTPAVPPEKLARIDEVWRRWHLNGMRAGCEHQRAEGWDERPIDSAKPLHAHGRHFEGQRSASWNMLAWVTPTEHPAGLLTRPCPECGYRYGSAWLHEPLPAEVVAEVEGWFSRD